jgi:hypothetical protein
MSIKDKIDALKEERSKYGYTMTVRYLHTTGGFSISLFLTDSETGKGYETEEITVTNIEKYIADLTAAISYGMRVCNNFADFCEGTDRAVENVARYCD